MNSLILVPLCVIAWIFTLVKLRAILKKSIREAGEITLQIWAMSLFFSITLTFMVVEFAAFFNTLTFPNLSVLVSHSSTLFTLYFGTTTALNDIGLLGQRVIRWIRVLLLFALIALLSIYILFILNMAPTSFFLPHHPAEVIFKLITCSFGIFMSIITVLTHLSYLPSKKFALIRFRGIIIILCALNTGIYLFIRGAIFGVGVYFWPNLGSSPFLITLSYLFLVNVTLLCFCAISSNTLYAQILIMSKSIDSWHAFQDLKYLMERLMILCPVIGLPPGNPSFFTFFFNPEYYLYRTIIIILDSKSMLADFLSPSMEPGTPQILWEEHLLQDAHSIHKALQSVNPSNDFADIVETYRRVSRDLFASQT